MCNLYSVRNSFTWQEAMLNRFKRLPDVYEAQLTAAVTAADLTAIPSEPGALDWADGVKGVSGRIRPRFSDRERRFSDRERGVAQSAYDENFCDTHNESHDEMADNRLVCTQHQNYYFHLPQR